MMSVYIKVFKIIFYTGNLPEACFNGNIKAIDKKSNQKSPEDFRPITLTSCSGFYFYPKQQS